MSVAQQNSTAAGRRTRPHKFGVKGVWSLAASIAVVLLAGCGPDRFVVLGSVPTPADRSLTGNWQIAVTTTSGAQPFSALTGAILQREPQPNGHSPVFTVLQARTPSACYLGTTTIPLEGELVTTSLSVTSLSVSGQYLDVFATSNPTGDTLTGTFDINNGCANGTKGTITGKKIADLSGTYAGPWTSGVLSRGISLGLTQDSFSDGLGFFHLQGSASFTGVPCFTNGTLQDMQSTISGQQVEIAISTNEIPVSTVKLSGVLDPAAKVLTITSVAVISGSCSGGSGTATLSL